MKTIKNTNFLKKINNVGEHLLALKPNDTRNCFIFFFSRNVNSTIFYNMYAMFW